MNLAKVKEELAKQTKDAVLEAENKIWFPKQGIQVVEQFLCGFNVCTYLPKKSADKSLIFNYSLTDTVQQNNWGEP